ncbi:MAG: RNA polymerase sigma factor [Flavobacteriales bacterium]|nr:RNA polymerase sigma factor [Flavobacteriales bacterium]
MIKSCVKKDRKAQNELYKQCYNVLIPVCWRYAKTKDQAVEYYNTGFLKILINLKKYKTKVPFELWCRRVMINAIIDEYRKSKQYEQNIELKSREEMANFEQQDVGLSEAQEDLLELIKSKVRLLPPVTSKVFNLYAIDGYKHSEIAELLHISEGTSMWHYSVAKKRLKQMINEKPVDAQVNERAS